MSVENPYDYPILGVVRVVDGDTVDLKLGKDIGFYVSATATVRVRLLNVDTPERGDPLWDDAKDYTTEWLRHHQLAARASTHKSDSFGRWLAYIYVPQEDGTVFSLNDDLIHAGLAKPYVR